MDAKRYIDGYLAGYDFAGPRWNYETGCILKGCIDLYRATGEVKYRACVLDWLSAHVAEDGSITGFDMSQYNVDSINAGKALFFALEETGEQRYRRAIDFLMNRLAEHPRCECGSYWHKEIYPHQVWLDGLYMAQPFRMEWEARFGSLSQVQDVTDQFRNVRKHLYCEEKGLSFHAWDEKHVQPWCDKDTGCSPNFWLRAMGWYLMALVDTIEFCPEMLYEHYRALIDLLRESVKGLLRYRAEDGLFYQLVDRADLAGNYTESSGSAMVAYAIMKAVRLGILLEDKYLPVGRRIMESLIACKLRENEAGGLSLYDCCAVAGLGPGEKRNGSAAYYLSEPVVENDPKAAGAFMMAWAEYLRSGV